MILLKLFLLLFINTVISNCSFVNIYKPNRNVRSLPDTHYVEDLSPPLILTPYLEKNEYLVAQNLSKVKLRNHENLESYSGYFTVDKRYSSNTFFWFFPAKVNYSSAPVILWLQGGAGASSLYGVFQENGPLEIVNGNTEPTRRRYSWSNDHSVIYIDNPVGAGFSFTDGGYCQNETIIGEHLYSALTQFFKLFPDLQKNDFFITGESYAGKYIPAVSYTILKKNSVSDFKINLKGICIGDGLVDPKNQLHHSEYLYQLGLIDINEKAVYQEYEKKIVNYIENSQWLDAFMTFDEFFMGDLVTYPTLFKNTTGFNNYFNFLNGEAILNTSFMDYVSRNDVREALHVGNTIFDDSNVEKNLRNDFMQSVAPMLSEVLSEYRVLLYSGQLDIIVGYPLTLNFLQKLEFSGAETYKTAPRTHWYVDNELAGYLKKAGNLSEVLVRNAGHMVPTDQPKWALNLITRFIKNTL